MSWLSLPVDLVVLTVVVVTARLWREAGLEVSISPGLRHEANAYGSGNSQSLFARAWGIFRREVVAFGLGCIAALVGLGFGLSALNKSVNGGAIQFLLAVDLTGKPWPGFEEYKPELKVLREGKWLVLIVRRDCEHCRELVEGLRVFDVGSLPFKVVTLVAGESKWPILFGKLAIESSAEHEIDWGSRSEPFVASPAAFRIEDGQVIAAEDGEDADGFVMGVMKGEK